MCAYVCLCLPMCAYTITNYWLSSKRFLYFFYPLVNFPTMWLIVHMTTQFFTLFGVKILSTVSDFPIQHMIVIIGFLFLFVFPNHPMSFFIFSRFFNQRLIHGSNRFFICCFWCLIYSLDLHYLFIYDFGQKYRYLRGIFDVFDKYLCYGLA